MPDNYNINNWINPSLDNPPEDAITDQPLNTYNGSEYVINGVTYRNLEAQVKHNQDSDKDLSERIDTTNARIDDVEDEIEANKTYIVKASVNMGTYSTTDSWDDAKAALDNGVDVILDLIQSGNHQIYHPYAWNAGYITFVNIDQGSVMNATANTRVLFTWNRTSPTTLTRSSTYSLPYSVVQTALTYDNSHVPTGKAVADYLSNNNEIFWCTHGTTTEAEISQALTDGKLPVLLYNGNLYVYYWTTSGYRYFMSFVNNTHSRIMMTQASSSWGGVTNLLMEQTANKVTSISATSTDAQYPSAKCVYDQLLTKQPNLFYECTYNSTTFADITTAVDAGLIPFLRYNGVTYFYSHQGTSSSVNYHFFTCDYYTTLRYVRCRQTTNAWSSSSTTAQTTSNKKSTPQTSASYYPDFSYINAYERMLVVTYTHATNTISSTFVNITTANANGRKIQMVDNLGTVYQLAYIDASKIIFSSCYMGAADADITCENVSITSGGVITYYTNQGG